MNEIDTILTKQIDKNRTPSVQYAIFNKDSIIHNFQGDFADINNKNKITKNTTHNAYSVTKIFTVLAILQLVEQGELDIEQPVINYLSEFPYLSAITILQLLSHSADIPNPIPLNWIHLADEVELFERNAFI